MKTNFRKLLSVVLSLVMIFTSLASLGITALAEEATPEAVLSKKGPFDFTDETDLAYGSGASVENGKLKVEITKGGNAKIRIPYELVSGTTYSVRYKVKAASEESGLWLYLRTAYAKNVDSWGGVIDHTNHIVNTQSLATAIDEWYTVEYQFTAELPAEDCKYLGFFIQANNKAATLYIDNLQIAPVVSDSSSGAPRSTVFDFSDAGHLEAAMGTYWAGSSKVEDGKLNVTIPNANYRMKTRYPFVLQSGAKYKVRYEITLTEAQNIGLYFAYASNANDDNMILHGDAAHRTLIKNGSLAAGTHIIEHTFTANIPSTGYDKLGLLFWANNANVAFSVDNLEIIRLDSESATFDFSKTSDLEYKIGTYGAGSATVSDGQLNVTIPSANYRMNTRFPFVLKDGIKYKVKFDVTLETATSFGIYSVYNSLTDTKDNPSYKSIIVNKSFAAGTHTIEYDFTAAIPAEGYDSFGLLFWATYANFECLVDNLEISVVDTDKAYFDFSDSSDLQYGYVTYNAGGASVQDNMLKVQINSANYRAKMKFPFALENGETYRVRFDIKADTVKQEMVYIAYAGSGTEENVIVHGTNKIDGGWLGLGNDFQTVEYTFTAACPEGNDQIGIFINAGSTAGNTLYIDNLYVLKEYLAPDTPNAPEIASHTENSVTLLDMRGYEYKMDDGEWQTSPVFENLVQGQTYSFYQRVAVSDIYGATSDSEAFQYFIANYGDVDRDGNIAAADLVVLRDVFMSSNIVYDAFAADVNKDGKINAIDVVVLKKDLAEKKKPVTPDFLSDSYEIVWHDEFDGDTLDKSKWNTGTYTIADNGYDGVTHIAKDDNAGVLKVDGGYLKLNNYAVANENGGMDYYTPEIATNKTYNFSYGYFEMRAKLASGNPLWQSFWACGSTTEEMPYKAEIDVIETYANGANSGKYDYTVHSWWKADATNLPDCMANSTSGHKRLFTNAVTDNTLTSEFHNYGCLWTETSLTFYLDGEVLREVVFAEDKNSDYFLALKDGNPMFLVLSLSTAREDAGTIDNEALANQVMLVDYVRVYQSENS